MRTTEVETKQRLACCECEDMIDCCEFCDGEECPKAICYGCAIVKVAQEIPQLHTHGG